MKCTRCKENNANIQYTPYEGSINYLCITCYKILGKEYNEGLRIMNYVEDNKQTFSVTIVIPEGKARIGNVQIPSSVIAGQSFDITYTLFNDGGEDVMYAEIGAYTSTEGQIIDGSHWEQVIGEGGSVTKTTTIIDGITEETRFEIVGGHKED